MKKSKKFLGIFNIVDVILILIVAIALGVGARLFLGMGNTSATNEDMKTYSYAVEGQRVLEETVNFPKIGENVYNSSTGAYLGTVKEVKSEPYMEISYFSVVDEYRKIPLDGYINLYITIEGKGTETEGDIIVEGTIPKVGMELNIKGKGYATKGYVVEVRDGE